MGHAPLPDHLRRLALRQHGVLSSRQLVGPLGEGAVRSLVRLGVLERVGRGVYRLIGSPPAFRQRAAIAVVAYGPPVAISHLAAARLWGAEVQASEMTVTLPPGRSGRRPVAAVRIGTLPQADLAVRHGLPVTAPGRTVVDLATGPSPEADELVLRVVDDLARQRHLTPGALAGAVADAHRRRVAGHPRLDALVAGHLEAGAAESALEARILRAVARMGIPPPVCQHQVLVEGRIRLLDAAWPPALLALQVDGYRWHGDRRRFDDDRLLDAAMAELGWLVVRATSRMDPEEVGGRLARAHEARLLRRPPLEPASLR